MGLICPFELVPGDCLNLVINDGLLTMRRTVWWYILHFFRRWMELFSGLCGPHMLRLCVMYSLSLMFIWGPSRFEL